MCKDGDSALFFGLSGTGKTTLSADRFGALLENVPLNEERQPDYDDGSVTENTRVGYPVNYISNAVIPGVAGHPKTVIFLTADAYGVLPPLS